MPGPPGAPALSGAPGLPGCRLCTGKAPCAELCAAACINKSTFYAHYTDIYALSETLEEETVRSIVSSIPDLKGHSAQNPDVFTRAICLAFLSNISLIKVLFAGKEQSQLGLLSYCIQGAYHAYLNNPSVDTESFVRVVEQIVKCLKPLL